MAHEILSVKLHELDDRLTRVYSRIHMSEAAGRREIETEIEALRREYDENEQILRTRLKLSRSPAVVKISDTYAEITKKVQEAKVQLEQETKEDWSEDAPLERRLLFAEYYLDIAMQTVDRALLVSLEAIDEMLKQEEGEEYQI